MTFKDVQTASAILMALVDRKVKELLLDQKREEEVCAMQSQHCGVEARESSPIPSSLG